MADAPRSQAELFQQLFSLQQDCMDSGNAEAAFHALNAALHCAEADRSVDGIRLVARLAEQRQQQVDAANEHQLSTKHADIRGSRPLFATLAVTAQSMETRLEADNVRRRSEALRRAANPKAP